MSTRRISTSNDVQGGTSTSASTESRPAPVVEQLLKVVHGELADLQATARALIRHGLVSDSLPSGDTLLAIAVLGDHGRAQVEDGLREHWAGLVDKGLIHGDLPDHSTPQLRLMLLVQPAAEVLDGLRSRMENNTARAAPPDVFRCAGHVDNLMWGQPVRLDYWIDRSQYLLIMPSRAFRRIPVLIHTGDGAGHGNIELPGDKGEVVFTIMGNDGQLYRHTTVFELRDADWLARSEA